MKYNTIFFSFDRIAKTVHIQRRFDAHPSLVWDVFTLTGVIEQWLVPISWTSPIEYVDFQVGGIQFRSILEPGRENWSIEESRSDWPRIFLKTSNTPNDQTGKPRISRAEWAYSFEQENGKTKVDIQIRTNSDELIEDQLNCLKKGIEIALDNVENLLVAPKV